MIDLLINLSAQIFLGHLASAGHFLAEVLGLLLRQRNVFCQFTYDFTDPFLREIGKSNAGENTLL